MCEDKQPSPTGMGDALLMLSAGLGYLTGCDAPGLGVAGQAEALAALERAEASTPRPGPGSCPRSPPPGGSRPTASTGRSRGCAA